MSPDEIEASNDFVRQNFPEVTILRDASGKYNADSYAWHSDSKDNAIWMQKIAAKSYWMKFLCIRTQEWTKRVYSVTTDPQAYSIISYQGYTDSGELVNHSARKKAPSSSTYISKWGAGPLVEHKPNDCLYCGEKEGYLVKYK